MRALLLGLAVPLLAVGVGAGYFGGGTGGGCAGACPQIQFPENTSEIIDYHSGLSIRDNLEVAGHLNPAAVVSPTSVVATWFDDAGTDHIHLGVYDQRAGSYAGPYQVSEAPAVEVNQQGHDTSSVCIDGLGYGYVSGLGYSRGATAAGGDLNNAPAMWRTTRPYGWEEWGDLAGVPRTSFPSGVYSQLEPQCLSLVNGNVLFYEGQHAITIAPRLPGGTLAFSGESAAVMADDTGAIALIDAEPGCTGATVGAKFLKSTIDQSPIPGGQILLAMWGWTGNDTAEPDPSCNELRDDSSDRHEMRFAYSTDNGANWCNAAGTTCVAAVLCNDKTECNTEAVAPIVTPFGANDSAFVLTTTRIAGLHHAWYSHARDEVYIVWQKSRYCDSGTPCAGATVPVGGCDLKDDPNCVTNPGALMLSTFDLAAPINYTERVIDGTGTIHPSLGGIRLVGSTVYLWATKSGLPGELREWQVADYGTGTITGPAVVAAGSKVKAIGYQPCQPNTHLMKYIGTESPPHYKVYRKTFAAGS